MDITASKNYRNPTGGINYYDQFFPGFPRQPFLANANTENIPETLGLGGLLYRVGLMQ